MALSRWERFCRSDITATVFAVLVMGGTFLLFGLKGIAWLGLILILGALMVPLSFLVIPDVHGWFTSRKARVGGDHLAVVCVTGEEWQSLKKKGW